MRKMGSWVALVSCILMVAACGQAEPDRVRVQAPMVEDAEEVRPAEVADDPVTGLRPAKEAGWELVFEDDFDRDEIGDDWIIADGSWEMKEGTLRGSGSIISAKGFPEGDAVGFQRIEFEAVTDVEALILLPGGPPPRLTVSDISPFIHAAPHQEGQSAWQTGYFFQFGGFNNTVNQIRRQGVALVADRDPDVVIEQDKVHHVVAENDRGHLRLYVDGDLILEHEERMSVIGPENDRIGFYLYTAAKIDNLKVYVKELPDGLDLD